MDKEIHTQGRVQGDEPSTIMPAGMVNSLLAITEARDEVCHVFVQTFLAPLDKVALETLFLVHADVATHEVLVRTSRVLFHLVKLDPVEN